MIEDLVDLSQRSSLCFFFEDSSLLEDSSLRAVTVTVDKIGKRTSSAPHRVATNA